MPPQDDYREECGGCRQLQQKVARLELEVTKVQALLSQRQSNTWWAMLLGGFALFVTWPVAALLLVLSYQDGTGSDLLDYAMYGVLYSTPWAQWGLIATVTMLLGLPIWQRIGLWIVLAALCAIVWSGGLLWADSGEDYIEFLGIGPFVACVIAAPVFLMRMTRRWTIARRDSPVRTKPVSISSIFALTAITAVVLAFTRFVLSDDASASDLLSTYLVVFPSVVLSCACLNALLLRVVLQRDKMTRGGLAWASVWMLVAAAIAPISPLVYTWIEGNSTFTDYINFVFFSFVATVNFVLMTVLTLLGLRMLRFELLAGHCEPTGQTKTAETVALPGAVLSS